MCSASTASATSARSRASGNSSGARGTSLSSPSNAAVARGSGILRLLRPALPRGLAALLGLSRARIIWNPSATNRFAVVVPVEARAARATAVDNKDLVATIVQVRHGESSATTTSTAPANRRPAPPVRRRGRLRRGGESWSRSASLRGLSLIDSHSGRIDVYPSAQAGRLDALDQVINQRSSRPNQAVPPGFSSAISYDKTDGECRARRKEPTHLEQQTAPAALDFCSGILATINDTHCPKVGSSGFGPSQAGKDHPSIHALLLELRPMVELAARGVRRCFRDPGSPRLLLHDVGHRGQRHRPAVGKRRWRFTVQPDPGDTQQAPRAQIVSAIRRRRGPDLVADIICPRSRTSTCCGNRAAAVSLGSRTPSPSTRPFRTCARSGPGQQQTVGVPDRRAPIQRVGVGSPRRPDGAP